MPRAFRHLYRDHPARLAAVIGMLVGAGLFAAYLAASARHPGPLPELVAAPAGARAAASIYFQVHETSIAEWNRCHDDGGCALSLRPPKGADPRAYPATGLNWTDAQAYARWLSASTGHPFRLPTFAEWTAAAEGVLPQTPARAFDDPALSWASAYQLEDAIDRTLKPAGAWSVTAAGIADLDGNVWEWTQDCYDGRTDTSPEAPCAAYVLGGEHRAVLSFLVRDPARGGCAVGSPPAHLGLRLVTDRAPPSRSGT